MNSGLAGRLARPFTVVTALACLLFVSSQDISIAGIQGSGYTMNVTAFGHITQFGSIFVNGVEYDTSAANIRINGQPGTQSQLRVGQVVTVKAEVNADGTAGTASDVSFSSDVVGPLAHVDLAGGTLIVLGQKIRLLSDTLIDENLHLGGILGLVPGIMVQVSGFPDASGNIVATRVDLALGNSAHVTGLVQGLDANAHTFRINGQQVDYSAVVPVGTLANGRTASIDGSVPLGQTTLRATRVAAVSGIGGAADEVGQIEGLISAFNSAADFMMGSQRIATDANTVFVLGGQALGPNLAVVVQGVFNSAGILVASEVRASSASLVGVLGAVESVSASGASLRALGVDFTTSNTTAFQDQVNPDLQPFALSDLHVGDYVEIRGGDVAAGGARQAIAVKRVSPGQSLYLEGPAVDLAAPNFKVLGVRVMTTSQTHFPDGGLLAAPRFFTAGANRIVKVRGTPSGQSLIAEQIEFVN